MVLYKVQNKASEFICIHYHLEVYHPPKIKLFIVPTFLVDLFKKHVCKNSLAKCLIFFLENEIMNETRKFKLSLNYFIFFHFKTGSMVFHKNLRALLSKKRNLESI